MKIHVDKICTLHRLWEKSLKCVIMNFHVFMRKLVLQKRAEQFISSFEIDIGQNNQCEIYPDMNFKLFLNM